MMPPFTQPLPMPLLPPVNGLIMDPVAHRYRDETGWFPFSVTNVISDLTPEARKRIMETKHIWEPRGNTVHACLEQHLLGEAEASPGDYAEWVKPLLSSWLFSNCEVLAVEYKLSDPIKRVAGCFDFLIKTERGTTVLGDLKTVSSAPAAKSRKPAMAQLGAYCSMLATHHPFLYVDRCVTVVAGPGCCEVKSSDVDACVAEWVAAWERHQVEQDLLYGF